MSSPVIIVDYDPDWPVQFERIKTTVLAGLGAVAVAVEHVGSTSVPGLAAKPILDIDVVVADESEVAAGIRLLRTLGYEHEGDLGITGREAFSVPDGAVPHHLYLVTAGGRELKRHLAFRDRLRADPEEAREYEALKRRLAAQFGAGRTGYSDAKTDFVEQLLAQELGSPH